MHPVLITPAVTAPVTLSEAKLHCRVDDDIVEFDPMLTGYIKAATAHLEKSLGYALVTQTWREVYNSFWCPLRLTMRPVASASVVIKYRDGANVEQTLASSSYTVFGDLVSFGSGVTLPGLYNRVDAVSVDYNAGVAVADVPADLKAALLLHIAFLFEKRESHSEKPWQPSGAYEALTFPYRRIWV